MPARSLTDSRWLTSVGVFVVLGIAAGFRFWALNRPDSLVFDELFYVRDAITQLAHGFPTNWPDDDTRMGAAFLDDPELAVHPPLGKWLIGLGILLFGADSPWGWRFASAGFGVATVGVTMRLAWLISRNTVVTVVAGLALAIDGVHVVLSRVSLLDGFLTFFVALGALFVWRDHVWVVDRTTPSRPELLWFRPWLFAAAVAFGCAASVKWSGLYPLAAFLVLVAVRDVLVRIRASRARGVRTGGAWGRSVLQALVTGLIALPTTFAVYVASWAGWITTTGGWGRGEGPWPAALWEYHVDMFKWHSTLSAPHPYQANPLTWPLALRPTAMYEESVGEGFTSAISPLPNPIIIVAGVVSLVVLVWWIVRPYLVERPRPAFTPGAGAFAAAFVLVGYLSGWLPWVLTFSRSAVFQFYAVVLTPFAALALALVVGELCRLLPRSSSEGAPTRGAAVSEDLLGRRLAVALFFAVALVLAVLFFPVWSAMPIPDWFWNWHHWLPGWD